MSNANGLRGCQTICFPVAPTPTLRTELKLNLCSSEDTMKADLLDQVPEAQDSDHSVDERPYSRAPSNDPSNQTGSHEDAEVTMCICPACGFSASSPRGQDEHMETEHGECYTGSSAKSSTPAERPSPPDHCSPDAFTSAVYGLRAASTPQQFSQPTVDNTPAGTVVDNPPTGLAGLSHRISLPHLPYEFNPSAEIHTGSTNSNPASAADPLIHAMNNTDPESDQMDMSATAGLRTRTYRGSLGRNIRTSSTSRLMDNESASTNALFLQKVDSRRRYRCNICPATFPWHGDLTEHLRLAHGMQKTRESARSGKAGNFCCNHCKYVAKYQSELRRHMRLHWGVKPFACVFCPYRSAWKGDLKRHMESHHRERFSSEAELVEIMSQFKNNAGTTVNGLPLTANSVTDAYNFSSDLESESAEDGIAYRLTESNELSSDEVSLTGFPKPPSSVDLTTLKGSTNKTAKSESSMDNALVCTVCSYKAQNQSKLQNHMAGHMNLKLFKCPICEHRSNYKWDVRKHLRSQHPSQTNLPVVILPGLDAMGNQQSTPQNLSPPESPVSLCIDTVTKTPDHSVRTNPIPIKSPIDANLNHPWSVKQTIPCEPDADGVPIDLSVNQTNVAQPPSTISPTLEPNYSTALPKLSIVSEALIQHNVSSLVDPKPTLISALNPTIGALKTNIALPGFSTATGMSWTPGMGVDQTSILGSTTTNNNTIGLIFNLQQQLLMHGLLPTWPPRPVAAVVPTTTNATTTLPVRLPSGTALDPSLSVVNSTETVDSTDPNRFMLPEFPLTADTIGMHGKPPSEWSVTETDPSDSTQLGRSSISINANERAEIHEPPRRTRGRKSTSSCYTRPGGGSLGPKEEQWKRHQCSGCGHRSNWKWDINKHIKVAHPERTNITTVTLELEEAKQTYGEYMNRLKLSRNRYVNDATGGALGNTAGPGVGWSGSMVPVGEGYYRPYKCSVCGHRSNWKWDVRKHIKHLHNSEAEVITLSLDEARRTIHQYKSCRRQQTRLMDSVYKTEQRFSPLDAPTRLPVSQDDAQHPSIESSDHLQSNELLTDDGQPNSAVGRVDKDVGNLREKSCQLYYPCRQCGRRFRSYPTLLFHLHRKHHVTGDLKTGSLPHLSIRFYYTVSRNSPRTAAFNRTHRTKMIRNNKQLTVTDSHERDPPAVENPDATNLSLKPEENETGQHDAKNSSNCVLGIGNLSSPSSTAPEPQFVVRNTLQRDRILRARRRTCVSVFPTTDRSPSSTSPLRPFASHDNASLTNRAALEDRPPDGEATIASGTVRQLSELLDKVLGILEEKTAPESLVARIPAEKSGGQVISHLADLIEETLSKNENIHYTIPSLNTSTSSNEENQPVGNTQFEDRSITERPLSKILHHPEIEQRFLRLATLLHAHEPNPTRYPHESCKRFRSNESSSHGDL